MINRVWSIPNGEMGVEMGSFMGNGGMMVFLKFYATGKAEWWAREHLRGCSLTHQQMVEFKRTGKLP